MKKILFLVCALILCVNGAYATDPNWTYKWSQLPDMTDTGFDVNATEPNKLADDWMCWDGLPITDIHWWGSYIGWQEDNEAPDLQVAPPHPIKFYLSQHLDIPAGTGGIQYSRPGIEIANEIATNGKYTVDYYGTINHGGFYEHIFQYNYILENRWLQDQGNIYWLDIQARYDGNTPNTPWGWHTAQDQWNDVPVQLIDPPDTWEPAPVDKDLAFELSTVPEPGAILLFGFSALLWFGRRIKRL